MLSPSFTDFNEICESNVSVVTDFGEPKAIICDILRMLKRGFEEKKNWFLSSSYLMFSPTLSGSCS